MQGECNCGAVRFELNADPAGIFVCHCSICRRATGSNGVAVVVTANENFRWLFGENIIASWKKPGADWQTWFCKQCGSMVPGHNDESRMFVPAGLLGPDAESLQVRHHIWVDSRASWDVIGDSGKQHREAFEG